MSRHLSMLALVCLSLTVSSTLSWGSPYQPSLSTLLGLQDNTLGFGPTQTSVLQSLAEDNGGLLHTVAWDAGGEGFSRVVLQSGLGMDLAAYDSLEFRVEALANSFMIKPYLLTGDNWDYYENLQYSLNEGDSTIVSMDLTTVNNLDNTRAFGYQVFGPSSGDGEFLVSPMTGVATTTVPLFSWDDDFEGWEPINWDNPVAVFDLSESRGVTDGKSSLQIYKEKPGFAWTATVTLSEDTNPDAYATLQEGIASGGALRYSIAQDHDDGAAHPAWAQMFWEIVDDVGIHQIQSANPAVPTTGAQATHLINLADFGSEAEGPLLADSTSYTLRFASNGPADEYTTVTTWLDNMSVVFYDTEVDLPGDFNADGTVDCADLDVMKLGDVQFDITGDGVSDSSDLTAMVTSEIGTWYGDSNCDGEFNSGDLVAVFTTGRFETGQAAVWSQGDWNLDGFFNTSDFVTAFAGGGFEQGPRAAVIASVPEPGSLGLLLSSLLASPLVLRRKSQVR